MESERRFFSLATETKSGCLLVFPSQRDVLSTLLSRQLCAKPRLGRRVLYIPFKYVLSHRPPPLPGPLTSVGAVQSALSVQANALAQKDAQLERASKNFRREADESHEREKRLSERVETLERLQETARRTVLDREERLRQAEANCVLPARRASSEEQSGCVRGYEPPASAREADSGEPGVVRGAINGAADRRLPANSRTAEKDLEEFCVAQEWWLHLAEVEKRREGDRTTSPEGIVATLRGSGGEGEAGKKEMRRLRRLVKEQGLEVVALRQRVLSAEMTARAKAREEEQRVTEDKKRMTTIECSLRALKFAENTRVAELEEEVAVFRLRGNMHEALGAAREELSAVKLALVRSKGEADLHAQLLVSLTRLFSKSGLVLGIVAFGLLLLPRLCHLRGTREFYRHRVEQIV